MQLLHAVRRSGQRTMTTTMTTTTNASKKRVLVTGTDSGIGFQAAQDLARQGVIVYAGCYTDDGARKLRSAAVQSPDDVRVVMLDISREDSVRQAVDAVANDLPQGQGLSALVNNAAIVGGVVFDWTTTQQYHDVMNVNFYGLVRMTMAALPLVRLGRGRIVNVASIMGRVSLNGSPYVCSKFAAEAYNDGLRRNMAPHGIKVSIIEPGVFPTNMASANTIMSELDKQWTQMSEERRHELGGEAHKRQVKESLSGFFAGYPLASRNRVQDVADCIRHAVTARRPKARYVCGYDARFLYRPCATILSDSLSDRLLKYVYGR